MIANRLRFPPALMILALAWTGAQGPAMATEAELQNWIDPFYQEVVDSVDETTRLLCELSAAT